MPRITHVRPGRPLGVLPTERHIRIGRRQVKSDGRPTYPERLDYMEVCLPGVDPDDKAGNRAVDTELMGRLLARQQQITPEEPSDKLRVVEVYLAPARDMDGVFGSQFRARTEDGQTVVCRGDGETARHVHYVDGQGVVAGLPAGFRAATDEHDLGPGLTTVRCPGVDCGWYARTDAAGQRPVYPRCAAEWELCVQLAVMESTFGVVRYRSKSIIGLDETAGVVDEVVRLVAEERVPSLSSVPLLLRMKNTRTAHGKQGVWTVYLAFQGPALAMIEAARSAYDAGRVLSPGASAPAQLAAHVDEPLVRPQAAADLPEDPDVVDVEMDEDEAPTTAEYEAAHGEVTTPPADDRGATLRQALRETDPPAEPADETPADDAPAPLWQHARTVALELEGGDEAAADARLREALDTIQEDDSEFPRPTRSGKWAATEPQAELLVSTLRALAELPAA